MDVQMETGDRFDGAMVAAINAHRDELHQLRMAVSVLALVPKYQDQIAVRDSDQETAADFEFKQNECIRIAKLYADESLLDHRAMDDVIAVLQEGLGPITPEQTRAVIAARQDRV